MSGPLSNELCVVLYCRFNPLWLNADIALCDGGGAVLQEPLHQGNIIAVCLVYLGGVPLAEAVGADTLIAQVVAHDMELLLYGPLGDGENQRVSVYAVPQAIVFYVLLDNQRNREYPALAGFLLGDFQTVSVPVPDNIAGSQLQYIADTQAQISLQHQGGGDTLIGAATAEPLPHGLDYLFILLGGERLCLFVHGDLHLEKFVISGGKVRV